ncbi:MAG TPA: hypothetical protein VKD22_04095 [Ramlibacter sp.]|jgi:hypothetical protein|nr:hypothetical protein [Ramlibacter sp.]
MSKLVIAFDGEFSGPFNGVHSLLALGLCAVVYNATGVVSIRSKRVCLAAWNGDHVFDPKCRDQFWAKEPMASMLVKFRAEQVPASTGIRDALAWMDDLIKEFGVENTRVVCDCPEDVMYFNDYVARGTQHPTLCTFVGHYVGWPWITDDFYRGLLRTTDAWGLDGRIDKEFELCVPKGDHDPVNDACEIALRFAGVLSKLGL